MSGQTLADFERVLQHADRNAEPALLANAYRRGAINASVVAACVGPVWCGAEFPDRALPWAVWRRLFDVAGYTVDGQPASRPTEPVTVYRAASRARRSGHSWTDEPAVARQFLDLGGRGAYAPVLWCAVADPWRLLARLEEERKDEPQYVIETTGLKINLYADGGAS